MNNLALTKVDVTRYPIGHFIYAWLTQAGFRPKIEGDRLYYVNTVH